jgi:hypothetical protein
MTNPLRGTLKAEAIIDFVRDVLLAAVNPFPGIAGFSSLTTLRSTTATLLRLEFFSFFSPTLVSLPEPDRAGFQRRQGPYLAQLWVRAALASRGVDAKFHGLGCSRSRVDGLPVPPYSHRDPPPPKLAAPGGTSLLRSTGSTRCGCYSCQKYANSLGNAIERIYK